MVSMGMEVSSESRRRRETPFLYADMFLAGMRVVRERRESSSLDDVLAQRAECVVEHGCGDGTFLGGGEK